MINPLKLYLNEINDPVIRENFFRLQLNNQQDSMRKSRFRFFTFSVPGAVSNLRIPHKLNYVPIDVIQLSVTGVDTTTVTWHYDSFDATFLEVSTDGACTVRAYVGRYEES